METTRTRANKTEVRAIASLFLGIASFAFGPIAGIPAIALGSAARKNAVHPSALKLTTAGTLSGLFGIGFFAIFALYLGNALLGAQADTASATTATDTQAKLTAPVSAPARPVVHRDIEMMRSPRH